MEGDCCFICLSDDKHDAQLGPLGRHCGCKAMFSHRSCLTRWQLQNAGKAEEKQCRFCKETLGDWRTALTEVPTNLKRSPPIMAVVFQGKTVKVPVVTGPEGVAEFKRTVCKLFNLPEGTDFEVTFECKSPVFGDKLHLKGFDCFEAASYCAAVSAAKRATHKAAKQQAATSTSSSTAASSSSPSTSSPAAAAAAATSTSTSLPALRGARSVGATGTEQQQEQQQGQQQLQGSPSDGLPSPSRLMRRLNESLHGDKHRRRTAGSDATAPQQGSNLRHVSTADSSAPLPASTASSSPRLGDSGALTPLSSSGTSTPPVAASLAGPLGSSGKASNAGALSFMRRLRAGILCTGNKSVDAARAPLPLQPTLSASSAPSMSNGSAPALPELVSINSAPVPTSPTQQLGSFQRPLATSSTGPGTLAPSSSMPSAATLVGTSPSPADLQGLQEPGSPAHHDNAPPAAHVATTTGGSGAAGSKPSGVAFAGSLVSMFRRVF